MTGHQAMPIIVTLDAIGEVFVCRAGDRPGNEADVQADGYVKWQERRCLAVPAWVLRSAAFKMTRE